MSARVAAVALALALSACAREAPPAPQSDPSERALDDVARIHGAAGAWAVAGYRMGEHALGKLGLPRGSFDLEVVHTSPKKVQFSCIADGASASTGASPGKLNLAVVEGKEGELVTVYRNKRTGASVALRPSPAFRARFLDAKASDPRVLGREVMKLPPDQVFEEAPAP